MPSRIVVGLPFVALALALTTGGGGGCTCSKPHESSAERSEERSEQWEEGKSAVFRAAAGGLSAPLAAARGENGDVVVAGLDAIAHAIRVQRISAKDELVAEGTIFDGSAWSTDSDLKMSPAAGGVAITWRGLRGERLVRQLLVLGADLVPKGPLVDVNATSCATLDALWFTDGKRVHRRPWSGDATKSDLPRDEDASLVCGAHRAFALLDEDDGTSLLMLGGAADDGRRDAGKTKGTAAASRTQRLLRESEFGEDEQRERAEYTIGDDLGVLRLAISGAVAMREVNDGVVGPLRKLKSTIARDDDVVAVDASPRAVVIVFTEDVSDHCPGEGGMTTPSTRVKALRIDRATFEESVVELSPGTCGREIGPFFSGAVGDAVSLAWVERVPVSGRAQAPVAGLAHRIVPADGPLRDLARVDQPADVVVDAGCDGARCYAVALARRSGMDAMAPGVAKVIRY